MPCNAIATTPQTKRNDSWCRTGYRIPSFFILRQSVDGSMPRLAAASERMPPDSSSACEIAARAASGGRRRRLSKRPLAGWSGRGDRSGAAAGAAAALEAASWIKWGGRHCSWISTIWHYLSMFLSRLKLKMREFYLAKITADSPTSSKILLFFS